MDAPCNWSLLIQLPESSDCLEKGLNDHKTVEDDECSWYSSGDKKSDLMIMSLNPRGEAAWTREEPEGAERDGIYLRPSKDW